MFATIRATLAARRARHAYEAARLAGVIADLQAEQARREAERNALCKWCAAGAEGRD